MHVEVRRPALAGSARELPRGRKISLRRVNMYSLAATMCISVCDLCAEEEDERLSRQDTQEHGQRIDRGVAYTGGVVVGRLVGIA